MGVNLSFRLASLCPPTAYAPLSCWQPNAASTARPKGSATPRSPRPCAGCCAAWCPRAAAGIRSVTVGVRSCWAWHNRRCAKPAPRASPPLTCQGTSRQQRSGTARSALHLYRAEPAPCAACPQRTRCTPGQGARTLSRSAYEEHVAALRQRRQSAEAKPLYKLRKQTVELANADRKEHRGWRRRSGRGLKRAEAQAGLTVLAHELVVLAGLRRKRQNGVAYATPASLSACKLHAL